MSKYLICSFFLLPTSAFAFDPFTAASAKGALSIVSTEVDELSGVGFALADLLSDLGIDSADEQKQIEEALNRYDNVNTQVNEIYGAGSELSSSINYDLKNGRNLKSRIHALRSVIANSKKIAAIMQVRPKSGQASLEVQKINIDSRILEEIQSIRKAQFLEYLENREARAKRELAMKQILSSQNKKMGRRK